jgi:hypothetical protein
MIANVKGIFENGSIIRKQVSLNTPREKSETV